MPLQRRLFGFTRVGPVQPGETVTATLDLSVDALAMADAHGSRVSAPQDFSIIVSTGDPASELTLERFALTGKRIVLEELPAGL